MQFVSVTRLRLRSVRFLPMFGVYTLRSLRQVRSSPGFGGGSLLPDRRQTYWTLTTWTDAAAMRAYRNSGAHLQAMKYLMRWCDEASYVHWELPLEGQAMPDWRTADERMRAEGKLSKVLRPSADHARSAPGALCFADPRLGAAAPIPPARR